MKLAVSLEAFSFSEDNNFDIFNSSKLLLFDPSFEEFHKRKKIFALHHRKNYSLSFTEALRVFSKVFTSDDFFDKFVLNN